MSFGVGVGDITLVASFAWKTYEALRSAPEAFRTLESEVQSLSVSLKSFDDDSTRHAILNYTNGSVQREKNFCALLENSKAALQPLHDLIKAYPVKSIDEKKDVREWLNGVKFARKNLSVQDFRNKLSMHTASLNIFLSSLTNFSVARLEKLILAGAGFAGGIRDVSAQGASVSEDGLNGTWSAIGPSLIRGNMTARDVESKVAQHRVHILNYLDFLLDGGKPFSRKELNERRDKLRAVTFALPRSRGEDSLMSFVDQMVMFDQSGPDGAEEPNPREPFQTAYVRTEEPSQNPEPSPRHSSSVLHRDEIAGSPSHGSPRIITVEPVRSPRNSNPTLYTYPTASANLARTPSSGDNRPRHPSISMARAGSVDSTQPRSPTTPAAMARTSSGSTTYVRPPSVITTSTARRPSGGGSQPRAILATTASILCDASSCRSPQIPTGGRYFHCGSCAAGGYDVCQPCYDRVERCPGRRSGRHSPMEPRIVGMLYQG